MVENDLFDFLLFSLPDNDCNSHRRGPHAQVRLARVRRPPARAPDATPQAALDEFLDDHAVIVVADHSHTTVEAATSI